MSGFDTHWLDLREPADHAARSRALLEAAGRTLADKPSPIVVDLGCGTGSTARALHPHLPTDANWRLVDHDAALLEEARDRQGSGRFTYVEADLRDLENLPIGDADLVTASALFDLVSQDWLSRFSRRLRESGAGLYAALSYDGVIEWSEVHPLDAQAVAAFNAHQGTDKGFGPALGPASPGALASTLAADGFTVEMADSPWRVTPGALHEAFLRGVAGAVRETRLVEEAALTDWLDFRLSGERESLCSVGHRDLLALPARSSGDKTSQEPGSDATDRSGSTT